MMRGILILGILFLLVTSQVSGHGLYQEDCEWLTTPSTYGPNAVFYNPALLSYPRNPGFSLNFVRAGVSIGNNTFSISNWNTYAVKDTLYRDDKDYIMGLIPEDGFSVFLGADAGLLGLKIGNFGFSPRVVGGANTIAVKDLIDLGFYGNALGRTYYLTGTKGEAIAYNEYGFGYSFPFKMGEEKTLCAGMSLTYVRGIFYGEVERIEGNFVSDSLEISAHIDTFHYRFSFSELGNNSGFSSNIGFAMDLTRDILVDLSFRNVFSYIDWTQEVESGYVAGHLDPINALRYVFAVRHQPDSIEDKWEEAFEGFYELDTASVDEQDQEFSRSLPILMNLGLSYHTPVKWKLFMQYEQGFKQSALTTTTPKFTLSGEYSPWSVLPLRGGFSIGGQESFETIVGFGFSFDRFYFDFGYGMIGGLFMGSKGQSLAFDMGIRSSMKAKVRGTIRDSVTLEPLIVDVEYEYDGKKGKVKSNKDGAYSFSVSAGEVNIIAGKEGYYPREAIKRVEKGKDVRQDFLLVPKFGYVVCSVMDSVTSNPLLAKIAATGAEETKEVTADEKGGATIKLLAGDYKFDVSYPEYAPIVRDVSVSRGTEVHEVFRLLKAGGIIKGLVYDAKTKEPITAAISVVDAETNKEVALLNTTDTGAYNVTLKKGTYIFKVTPDPKEYIYQESTIPLASGETVNKNFALLKKEMKFVFHNILFDFDKATLRPESYPVLDSIGKIMIENPTIITELSGHTDSRGSRSYNRRLSQRRANSARNYIIHQWRISPTRMVAKGYGEDRLIIPKARTEAEHQQNRRVEFTVIREIK
ncbi:OmpA family protein [candidate division WOR-3 bacterium]|nr:OmpA family protein [candidate division WOR-3 bacterium]